MSSPAPSLLRRWLTLLMVGLLALGPFLHSHLGASHDTGFHLDGVHPVHKHAPHDMSAVQTSHEESPALGVAASLPHPEDEVFGLLGFALLAAVLPLLSPCRQLLPRPHCWLAPASQLYQAGLPPPCQAPPIA